MKKIEGKLNDDPSRNILLFISLPISILIFLIIRFGIYLYPLESFGSFGYYLLALGVPFLLLLLSKTFMKTNLSLELSDNKLALTIKSVFSKKQLMYPFIYDAVLVPIQVGYTTYIHLKLTIFSNHNSNSFTFYEKIPMGVKVEGIELEIKSKQPILGIVHNQKPYPSVVWEIYQALEKYSGKADTRKESVNSPFV